MVSTLRRFAQRTSRSIRKRIAPQKGIAAARFSMPDVDSSEFDIMEKVEGLTMVSADRLLAFMEATRYIENNNIEGAIVECGVWKGGASMASMLTLLEMNGATRDYYLYDTYEGMNAPTEHDQTFEGKSAQEKFDATKIDADSSDWCRCSLDDVRENVLTSGYDADRIHFVKGKVEDSIPGTIPEKIALLRLDTDWYVSTKHELDHLFPLLEKGGPLLIDDYGHWDGVRKAVDEYFADNNIPMLLHRTDYTGRAGIKI